MRHLFGTPMLKNQIQQVEAQKTAARLRNKISVGNMLDELEWLSLESRREQSYLNIFL